MSRSELKTWTGPHGSGSGWICDTCGQPIENAGQGFLEWLERYDKQSKATINRGIHIVHHAIHSPNKESGRNCYFERFAEFRKDGSTLSGGHLDTFLGDDGLTQLLAMLGDGFQLRDELLEVIMRLHIENYERARPHLKRAVSEGGIEPNMRAGFHWQQDLRSVVSDYSEKSED